MGTYIGIDLGTTYSAVSFLDDTGRPQIIDNPSKADGNNITASNVAVIGGNLIVGNRARVQFQQGKSAFARFKRDMGTSVTFEHGEKEITPTELSSLVLRELKKIAEEEAGDIEKAVVTIPANFGNDARDATMEAAKNAGLNIDHIINEPTAAALYFAFDSGKDLFGNYAIFDLGGGTFDVSILRIEGQNIEILATDGISKLGGDDFDRALQNIVKAKYKDLTGDELADYEYTLIQAEQDKISLSTRRKCLAGGDGEVGDGSTPINLTRQEFEDEISSLLAQCEILCESAISDAGLEIDKIEDVILVGGSTRIPAVKETIKRVFNKQPVSPENVDEMVALGATLYAAHKSDKSGLNASQKKSLSKMEVGEITSSFFGTLAYTYSAAQQKMELANTVIIKKGAKIPVSVTEMFATVDDNQTEIQATITEAKSEETDPKFVDTIWSGELDLPPDRPAGQPIEVTYSYDDNGLMNCVFKDIQTEKILTVEINASDKAAERSDEIEKFLVD
jgi:molecular chaperone DnaK